MMKALQKHTMNFSATNVNIISFSKNGKSFQSKTNIIKNKINWLRGLDLNQRPLGYEPNELPDCSTPR